MTKLTTKQENHIRSACGRLKSITLKDKQGKTIHSFKTSDSFINFLRSNKERIQDYTHILKTKSNASNTAVSSYEKSMQRAIGNTPNIFVERDSMNTVKKSKKSIITKALKTSLGTSTVSTRKTPRKQQLKTQLKGSSQMRFREIEKSLGSQYLSIEEMEHASVTDPITRKRILSKADRMARDPAYRAKVMSRRQEKKGRYERDYARAKRLTSQRIKSATSPWWKAYHYLSHNLTYLLILLSAVSLIFIPVGLFQVSAWCLAVGLSYLMTIIIWVFVEAWFLISSSLVMVINLIGQTFNGIVNFIGNSLGNSIGYEFNPFEHILVQNLPLANGTTWGSANLTPASFLNLDEFMPLVFDTDTVIAKIFPTLTDFFRLIYGPIAQRYLDWIATAEWYYVGGIIGVPLIIILIGLVGSIYYFKRRVI